MVAAPHAVGAVELLVERAWTDACVAFVVSLGAITSHAARVFGLLILGLNLRHRMSRLWELWTFLSSLALVAGSCWLRMYRPPPRRSDFLPVRFPKS